jgi:hypothetical protein
MVLHNFVHLARVPLAQPIACLEGARSEHHREHGCARVGAVTAAQ